MFEVYLARYDFEQIELFCQDKLPTQSVPISLVSAILAQEDVYFFSHHGVDLAEVYHSIVENISELKVVRGASTIDMQVASLCFAYPHSSSSWYSKFKEVIFALMMQSKLSKAEILELYLIAAPFGNERVIHGFLNAARFYYHKNLMDLTPREIWSLVIALKNRKELSPLETHNLRSLSLNLDKSLARSRKRAAEFSLGYEEELEGVEWLAP